jgi:hypothetical protein
MSNFMTADRWRNNILCQLTNRDACGSFQGLPLKPEISEVVIWIRTEGWYLSVIPWVERWRGYKHKQIVSNIKAEYIQAAR